MDKIEHIGIAVENLERAIIKYEQILQTVCYKTEVVEHQKVRMAFFLVGESKIELLEAINNEGTIADFIEKRGEGIHHIAYEVQDINAEMYRLKNEGYRLLSDSPQIGADHKLVCFIHPKDANGVLTELVQSVG